MFGKGTKVNIALNGNVIKVAVRSGICEFHVQREGEVVELEGQENANLVCGDSFTLVTSLMIGNKPLEFLTEGKFLKEGVPQEWKSPKVAGNIASGLIDVSKHSNLTIDDAKILLQLLCSAIEDAERILEHCTDEQLAILGQKWSRPLSSIPKPDKP